MPSDHVDLLEDFSFCFDKVTFVSTNVAVEKYCEVLKICRSLRLGCVWCIHVEPGNSTNSKDHHLEI